MNHYDYLPDTTVYVPSLPERFGVGLGYGRCECSPTDGQSCPACDGTDAERAEMRRMPRREREALETANARLTSPAVLRDDRERGAA